MGLADRLALDVGPIQVLGPGHRLARPELVDESVIAEDRRLVRYGDLEDWAPKSERR